MIKRLSSARWFRNGIVVISLVAVLLPLAVIWIPEFRHYYVATPRFDAAATRRVLENMNPATCTEFSRHDLMDLSDMDQGVLERAIRGLDRNVLDLAHQPEIPFTPRFAPNDLVPASSRGQLATASLVIPDLMLRAWDSTGRIQWLRAARDYVMGWQSFERRTLFPLGLQWNDHAVAARTLVLTRFLCAAKQLPEFADADRASVLEMIFASGERLTKPTYYTYRTNHGIMQNLALLHIAASFPAASQSKRFAEVGISRLKQQLKFYVGPEGPVLEHSAGYHGFGVELLGMAMVYFRALGEPLPEGFPQRYVEAVEFFKNLHRPDGTLPSWGNTTRLDDAPRVLVERPAGALPTLEPVKTWPGPSAATWAPISGVAIWWNGVDRSQAPRPLAQTLVTWADFATQAHKHADEMSLLVWTDRSDILIASGYWPYDAPHRHEAVGWAGSNAPRYVGEDSNRRGKTRLLGSASTSSLEFADMERTTVTGAKLRRQVIYLRPNRWIVIDTSSVSSQGEFEATWIFDPQLTAELARDRKSVLLRDARGAVARADLGGCEQGTTQLLDGSINPFGGWTAAYGEVLSAPALLRRCSANHHASFVLRTLDPASASNETLVTSVSSPESWEIHRPAATDRLVVRSGNALHVNPELCGSKCQPLPIADGTHYAKDQESINLTYQRVAQSYTRFNESWLPFRIKASKVALVAWVAQLAVMFAAVKLPRHRLRYRAQALACLAIVCWLVFTVWLEAFYFT